MTSEHHIYPNHTVALLPCCFVIESSLTREEAFMFAINKIPEVEALHTTVHSLSDWYKAKGGCTCVRARLWNGLSLLLGYEQEGDEQNGYIKGIWIRSY